MSKRGGLPGGMGGFGGMNINQLMKESKKMQGQIHRAVAAKLVGCGVLVLAGFVDVLAKEIVGIVGADGDDRV